MSNINGIPIFPVDEIIFERNIREDHDFAYITIHSDRSERFETNDKVDIDGNTDYIVQTDLVTQISDDLFEHRISLYENLARFDKVIPTERVFSRITIDNGVLSLMTLGDIFSHYKRELEFYEGINIDLKDDGTGYENVQIPLKEFSGGVNFTSIMFELFRRIKANPKVERDGNTWVFYPQYWYTRKNNVSQDIQALETNVSHTNAEDYATQVKSLIKNGSSELVETAVFPSENGYVWPKSNKRIALESDLRYELDSPILLITKAEIIYKEAQTDLVRDITEHVVTKEEYDVLPPGTFSNPFVGITARNCLFYEIGSRFVGNLFESATDRIVFSQQDTNYLYNAIGTVFPGFTLAVPENQFEIRKVGMRFEYIRERNVAVSAHRQFQGFMNETSVIHSQRDSRVEANRFKNNLDILSNRMGNTERSISFQKSQGENLVDVFDYVGNELVSEVKNSILGDAILQEIKLSQNFVNANSEYAVSRRLDPFTITRKLVTTNFLLNDFVEVSRITKPVASILTERGIENFLKTFANDTSAEPIEASVFRSTEQDAKAIHMPIMKLTGGNLSFHAFFDSPRVAGYQFIDGENEATVLPYADDDGIVTDFNWFLTDDVLIEDDGSYPDISDDYSDLAFFNSYTTTTLPFPADLDPLAAFAITYQLNPVVDDTRFIIGEGFTKYNFLLGVETLDYKVYAKAKPYSYQDIEIGEEVTGATMSFDVVQRKMTFTTTQSFPHFALVHNGDIVIAFNEELSTNGNVYYLNFRVSASFLRQQASYEHTFAPDFNYGVDLFVFPFEEYDKEIEPNVSYSIDIFVQIKEEYETTVEPEIDYDIDLFIYPIETPETLVTPELSYGVDAFIQVDVDYEHTFAPKVNYDIDLFVSPLTTSSATVEPNIAYGVDLFVNEPESYEKAFGVDIDFNIDVDLGVVEPEFLTVTNNANCNWTEATFKNNNTITGDLYLRRAGQSWVFARTQMAGATSFVTFIDNTLGPFSTGNYEMKYVFNGFESPVDTFSVTKGSCSFSNPPQDAIQL